MTNSHSMLSPSSAERWFACPGSARLIHEKGRPTFSAASELGTLAHAWLEFLLTEKHKGNLDIFLCAARAYTKFCSIEMQGCVNLAYAYIDDILTFGGHIIDASFEQKVDLSFIDPCCFGTSDAIIVTPKCLYIIDYKHGKTVVDVEENKQLLYYAVGAVQKLFEDRQLEKMEENFEVKLVIIQPNTTKKIKEFSLTFEQLQDWRENQLVPAVKAALKEDAEFKIGSHCRWCPVENFCPAQIARKQEIFKPFEDSGRECETIEDF